MPAPATEPEILEVNRRYHDVAAREYDAKWGISFGEVGRRQVVGKLSKLLGSSPGPYGRSLEIGAGTGYFTLNLMQAGVVASGVCTDVSPGMLDTLRSNADRLGLDVETRPCDAAELPFEDASFDLVLGHAVLHHLPDLHRAFGEFRRVLRPGGHLLVVDFRRPASHRDHLLLSLLFHHGLARGVEDLAPLLGEAGFAVLGTERLRAMALGSIYAQATTIRRAP